jgi:hypothetical protein
MLALYSARNVSAGSIRSTGIASMTLAPTAIQNRRTPAATYVSASVVVTPKRNGVTACRNFGAARIEPHKRLWMARRKPHDTIGVRNRHRLQQRRIDDAEDGGVGCNAKGKDKDDYSGENWRPGKGTRGVKKVRHK